MSKNGVPSGPYFPVFNPSTGKYGPEKTPYLDFFHAVQIIETPQAPKYKTLTESKTELTYGGIIVVQIYQYLQNGKM